MSSFFVDNETSGPIVTIALAKEIGNFKDKIHLQNNFNS